MKVITQQYIGTTEEWQEKNPVLYKAVWGFEETKDGNILAKIGDGKTHWTELKYIDYNTVKMSGDQIIDGKKTFIGDLHTNCDVRVNGILTAEELVVKDKTVATLDSNGKIPLSRLPEDAATKKYVDDKDTQNIKKAGDQTIEGNTTFNGHIFVNADAEICSLNLTEGLTVRGDNVATLDSNNKLPLSRLPEDVATKKYVDDKDTGNVKTTGDQEINGKKTFIGELHATCETLIDECLTVNEDLTVNGELVVRDKNVRGAINELYDTTVKKTGDQIIDSNYLQIKNKDADFTSALYFGSVGMGIEAKTDRSFSSKLKISTPQGGTDQRRSSIELRSGLAAAPGSAEIEISVNNKKININENVIELNPDGNEKKITGLSAPVNNSDAVTKKYVDEKDNENVKMSGEQIIDGKKTFIGELHTNCDMHINGLLSVSERLTVNNKEVATLENGKIPLVQLPENENWKTANLAVPANTATNITTDTAAKTDTLPNLFNWLRQKINGILGSSGLGAKQNSLTATGTTNLLTAPASAGGQPGTKAIADFQSKLNRTINVNDNSTVAITDEGGDLTIPLHVTVTAGTAASTLPTSNSKMALRSFLTTVRNCLAWITGTTTGLGVKLDKSGGTMSGAINMGINKITNLASPTGDLDAATKAYVDSKYSSNIGNSGGGRGSIAISLHGDNIQQEAASNFNEKLAFNEDEIQNQFTAMHSSMLYIHVKPSNYQTLLNQGDIIIRISAQRQNRGGYVTVYDACFPYDNLNGMYMPIVPVDKNDRVYLCWAIYNSNVKPASNTIHNVYAKLVPLMGYTKDW